MPNPYDPEQLKRQAQMNALTPGKSLTSDEYFALNQANAKANPVAPISRPSPEEFRAQNAQTYGYDGTYGNAEQYFKKKAKSDFLKGVVLPVAAFATGGAASAALMGGGAAGAGAGLGVKTAVDGTALGTGLATGGGAQVAGGAGAAIGTGTAKAASGIPWGKLLSTGAQTVNALGDMGAGGDPSAATSQPVNTGAPTTTPPPVTTANASPSKVASINAPPPPGWDAKNWADPNMHTVKYDAGRLLYGVTKPSEVAARVNSPEFQARFPGATFDGKDKIDFKGVLSEGATGSPVGLIDVLMSADQGSDSSNGLWWGFEPDGGEASTAASGGTSAIGALPMLSPAEDNSTLARIMAELQAASTGDLSPAQRAAILNQL